MQYTIMSIENLSFIYNLNTPPMREYPLRYAGTDRNKNKSHYNMKATALKTFHLLI